MDDHSIIIVRVHGGRQLFVLLVEFDVLSTFYVRKIKNLTKFTRNEFDKSNPRFS